MRRRTSRLSIAFALHEMEMKALRDEFLSRYRPCPATGHLHPDYRRVCEDCLDKTCSKLAERGLDDNRMPLAFNDRPGCGAMTRIGAICQNRVVPGKQKCRLHGGKSTGPKTLAGKRRIGDAQRLRWARYRIRKSNAPEGTYKVTKGQQYASMKKGLLCHQKRLPLDARTGTQADTLASVPIVRHLTRVSRGEGDAVATGSYANLSNVRCICEKITRGWDITDVEGGERPAAVHHGNQGIAREAAVRRVRSVNAIQIGRRLFGAPIDTMQNGSRRNIVRVTDRSTPLNGLIVSRD